MKNTKRGNKSMQTQWSWREQPLQLLFMAGGRPMTKQTGQASGCRDARRLLITAFALAIALIPGQLIGDEIYTFSTIPNSGDISGAPGATVGWGYSITNQSTSDWLLATNLNADSFAFGTPALLFDFPEIAPGTTVTELFDPIGMTGLYEDVLNLSAPNGSVDSGNFVLSAQWYDGDPFNGGNFIADAIDSSAPYMATVNSSTSPVPEPSSFSFLIIGTLLIAVLRLSRSRLLPVDSSYSPRQR
jgi:hypothetical protein